MIKGKLPKGFREFMGQMGKIGGKRSLETMTAAARKARSKKAAAASAKVRTAKAKAKRAKARKGAA